MTQGNPAHYLNRGRSSVVERYLAKVEVESSSLSARSKCRKYPMRKIVNIKGILHAVRDDRIVLLGRTFIHLAWWPNVTPDEIESYRERIGGGISVWAVNGVLKKPDYSAGMVAPREERYIRRK